MRGVSSNSLVPIPATRQLPRVVAAGASMDSIGNNNNNSGSSNQRQCDAFVSITSNSSSTSSQNTSSSSSAASAMNAIQFLTLCQRLKTTKRTGWVNHGLKESESIADHMYRMAIMALVVADGVPGVDKDRCVKMAVVHDLAEAIVGDITPNDGVPKAEKNRLEREAMETMCAMLGGGLAAQEMKDLWEEYENDATPEAKLVKDFDKVEMILQAQEYEEAQGKQLDDFFRTTKGQFQTDAGKALAAEVIRRRPILDPIDDQSQPTT